MSVYYFIKELFKFSGRVNRKKYTLFIIPFSIYCTLISLLNIYDEPYNYLSIIINIITVLFFFRCVVIVIQRLHDLNLNGFWCIWFFIMSPILFTLCFFKGTPGSNQYGEPPND